MRLGGALLLGRTTGTSRFDRTSAKDEYALRPGATHPGAGSLGGVQERKVRAAATVPLRLGAAVGPSRLRHAPAGGLNEPQGEHAAHDIVHISAWNLLMI